MRKRLDSLATRFTLAGAAGAAAFGIVSKAGLDTEATLFRTQAALGLTTDQMRRLREEALTVGSQLPLNTKDIIAAQLAYGKLGATFDEIIRDTPAIAGAAAALALEGIQPEQVARYAQIVQNVFGGDITHNLDLMIRLANKSPASFAALGESLQFSGQSAADAGLDFQTYLATLGGLAGAGRSVDSVSQGLQAVWARLAKSGEGIGRGGKIVADAFTAVGISMDDVNATMDGTSQGFVNLLELIGQAGLSSEQLTALMSTLAGDTYAASLSFAVQHPEAIRQLLGEAELAAGEIERQNEIILQGASGGITEVRAQLDTLLNRLADLGPLQVIEAFANRLNGLISWLTQTSEQGEEVHKTLLTFINVVIIGTSALLGLGIALKVASFALGGYSAAKSVAIFLTNAWNGSLLVLRVQLFAVAIQAKLAGIAQWFLNTSVGVGTAAVAAATVAWIVARTALIAGAIATGVMTAAQWALNIAMTANPIGVIIVLIGLLVAALIAVSYAVWHFRDSIIAGLGAAWNWIKDNWPLLLAILTGPIGLAVLAFIKYKDKIIGLFQSMWDFISGINLFEAGKNFLQTFIDGILSIGDGVKDAVMGVLGKARDLLPFSDAKIGPLSELTASGKSIVDTIAEGIRSAKPLLDALAPQLSIDVTSQSRAAEPSDGIRSGDPMALAPQLTVEPNVTLPDSLAPQLPDGVMPQPLTLEPNILLADVLVPPLPVGPVPQTAAAGAGGPMEFRLSIDRIEISVPSGEPQDIAVGLRDALSEAMRSLVEQADSPIRA